MTDKRVRKIKIEKAGGNSGKDSKKYSITLPSVWMKALKVKQEDRDVTAEFDGEKIIIKKDQEN